MNRRSIFKVTVAALAAVPLIGRKAAAATGDAKMHKVVLHVDENDAGIMRRALANARNCQELFAPHNEGLEIEVVCYGPGLHMLRDDTSPVKDEIKQTRAKVPQVTFGACNNTKRAMEKTEGKIIPIIPEAHVVPAGIVRIVELQEEGFSYVKP
jgi:intracellular sulfur oxidation DsrE/DsrF family protein